ncbi:MAG: ParB/RepB/Spo0J family partition protein [Lachnospiraceae bacterium]|nr:ParB/RepB/Spo0J family partition protein [Lachnospiraceae bacterium]
MAAKDNTNKTTPAKKSSGKRGLGKGLSSMLGSIDEAPVEKSEVKAEAPANTEGGVTMMKLTKIEPNKDQARNNFNEDKLQELADSIKEHGIIEPIIVQDRGTFYQIIAGERRWRASRLLGLKEVPVIIKHYTSEQEILEVSLIENIQRENLNPIEEAQAYKKLIEECNLKQDDLATRVGKSRSEITNSMRILKLCPDVQQMVIDEMLSKGHARTLIAIEDPKKQYEIAQQAFDKKLSVRELEKLVKNLDKPGKIKPATDEQLLLIYNEKQEQLKQALGTKVSINAKGKGAGSITIDFYNHDEFDKFVYILTRDENK